MSSEIGRLTVTRMTDEAVRKVERRFRRTSTDLTGAREEMRGIRRDLEAGAGELAQVIEGEARHFQNSWRAVLELFAESADLVAANTNAQYLDLQRIDEENGA